MPDGCDVPRCAIQQTRLYPGGRRCDGHKPGPLPAGRYCAPARCYCGDCPSWTDKPLYVDNLERTVVDARAIASGRRRSSLESYRAAQKTLAEQKAARHG